MPYNKKSKSNNNRFNLFIQQEDHTMSNATIGANSFSVEADCKPMFDESKKKVPMDPRVPKTLEPLIKHRLPSLNTRESHDFNDFDSDVERDIMEDEEEDLRPMNSFDTNDQDLARVIEESMITAALEESRRLRDLETQAAHAQTSTTACNKTSQSTDESETHAEGSDDDGDFEFVSHDSDDKSHEHLSSEEVDDDAEDWSVLDEEADDETTSQWTSADHGTFRQAVLSDGLTLSTSSGSSRPQPRASPAKPRHRHPKPEVPEEHFLEANYRIAKRDADKSASRRYRRKQ